MTCKKCGAEISFGQTVCSACGALVKNDVPSQSSGVPTYADDIPMNWYSFLIYFSLFASAISNLLTGYQLITGSCYFDQADTMYKMVDGLKNLDTIVGSLSIGIAILCIVTRFALSGYRKIGPVLLALTYGSVALLNLGYMLSLDSILPDYITKETDLSSFTSSAIASGVLLVCNIIYFRKRKHLFVR
ncbi:MAG: hypothetical protein E7413_00190 [Ruminococcaceae bacterium]|nr:hypothetical protein [Oscillospiraceae bacterium]